MNRRWILAIIVLLPIILGSYYAGSLARAHCVWPFCRGLGSYLQVDDEDYSGTFGDGIKHVQSQDIESNLYRLQADEFSLTGVSPERMRTPGRDGGMATLGHDILVASRQGDLMVIGEDFSQHTMLSARIPVPIDAFKSFVDESDESERINISYFGVKDIYTTEISTDTFALYATYNNWNPTDRCYTLKLSRTTLTKEDDEIISDGAWEDVFESSPCLELKDVGRWAFNGHQSGGRVAKLTDTKMLLTVGDFRFDGYNSENLPQDVTNDYGKTILVDLEGGTHRVFSLGHRNSQGLHVDEEGRIWSTEHGPKGGDELNLIEEDSNYGWPNVSYGVQYGAYSWPVSERDGSHQGYVRPIFSWTPAIAPAQLVSIRSERFGLWDGDLLIAGMVTESLYRVRIREDRAVFSEEINVGRPIRDLAELEDGSLVLKTDHRTLIRVQPIDTGDEGVQDFYPLD